MRKLILFCIQAVLLFSCGSSTRVAAPALPDHMQMLYSDCMTIYYDHRCKQPRWVKYTLTADHLQGSGRRKDNFKPDPRLSGLASAQHSDYSKTGYDRGHLAPAGDMARSQKCMDESFYYSNISPQVPGHNRGVWLRLEKQVRDWTANWDSLIVVTGPILDDHATYPTIGTNAVCVPELFFKSILAHRGETLQAIAFVVPNEGSREALHTFAVSVDSLEVLSGIDFFDHLPDTTQKRIESVAEFDRF